MVAQILVSSTSGWSSLTEVGLVPLLLPLLQDEEPAHVPLVSAGLRILEAMMDFSTTAVRSGDSDVVVQMLCDLGGLGFLEDRLQHEVEQYNNRGGGDAGPSGASAGAEPMESTGAALVNEKGKEVRA